MTVLNNLRLVLGTLLDVGEDDFEDDIDENDPTFGQWQLHVYWVANTSSIKRYISA
jgi:hypothetical protein